MNENIRPAIENLMKSRTYEKLITRVREEMRYADYIDITSTLDITDYYRTDTHWRQEKLLDTAATFLAGMGADSGVSGKDMTDTAVTSARSLMALDMNESGVGVEVSGIAPTTSYEVNALDRPFYGVYYGQSALPLPPETLYYLTNETLEHCVVTNRETGAVGGIYDMDAAAGRDPYEIFLSGARPLMTIENPDAAEKGGLMQGSTALDETSNVAGAKGGLMQATAALDKTSNVAGAKELIIFRDSFGSGIAPLLVDGYRKVTLVDIRYLRTDFLDRFIDFDGQDVLFLYSTSVLNHSETLT